MRNRVGSRWLRIPGNLMQIDSGPFGIVWGVNRRQIVFCRTGITWRNPKGSGWCRIGGKLKYISCGELGCWGVSRNRHIVFRNGVSRRKPQGEIGLGKAVKK